jgi:hypothetical protein
MEAVVAGDSVAAGRASDALLDYVDAFTRTVKIGELKGGRMKQIVEPKSMRRSR